MRNFGVDDGTTPENIYFRIHALGEREKRGYRVKIYCDSSGGIKEVGEVPVHLSWDEWYEIKDFFSKINKGVRRLR